MTVSAETLELLVLTAVHVVGHAAHGGPCSAEASGAISAQDGRKGSSEDMSQILACLGPQSLAKVLRPRAARCFREGDLILKYRY